MEQLTDFNLNKFLKKVIEKTDEGFFIYHLSSQEFIYYNASFLAITEQTASTLKQKLTHLMNLIYKEDREFLKEKINLLLNNQEETQGFEVRISLEEKDVKYLNTILFLIEDSIAGIIEDVTLKKHFEDHLFRVACSKNSTLNILAHDLAGPFASIEILTGLIEKDYKKKEIKPDNKFFEHIRDTCKRSIDLISDYINEEFQQTAEVELKKERVELMERLNIIFKDYHNLQDRIQKNFKIEASQDKFYVQIDDMKFMQVMNNLVSNAVKFTNDGGNIIIRLEDEGDNILITVEDDGIGIPEKYHSVLFDKFTKARRPGLRGEKSTGLGMSIIKRIVEMHHGKIWFHSEENKGTKFFISLPSKSN